MDSLTFCQDILISYHKPCIVDACVEFCFLKIEFLNLTINMQPSVTSHSFSQAPSACGVQCFTERMTGH